MSSSYFPLTEKRPRGLLDLTLSDAVDCPFKATERNVEIAISYALRTAQKWVKRHAQFGMDCEAFEEAVILAILKARDSYDPSRKPRTRWFTYARGRVLGSLLDEARRQSVQPQARSLHETRYGNPYANLDLARDYASVCCRVSEEAPRIIDSLRDPNVDLHRDAESKERLRHLMEVVAPSVLDERETLLITCHYLQGMSAEESGAKIGISRSLFFLIRGRALAKLAAALRDKGDE